MPRWRRRSLVDLLAFRLAHDPGDGPVLQLQDLLDLQDLYEQAPDGAEPVRRGLPCTHGLPRASPAPLGAPPGPPPPIPARQSPLDRA